MTAPRTALRRGDHIAVGPPAGATVYRVEAVHALGHHLREPGGYVDQFDSLPSGWRRATDQEVAVFASALRPDPCAHLLSPARDLEPAEYCGEDAAPGADRCEAHIYDDEEGR